MKTIRIGSRESKLAVTQSQMVMENIAEYHKDCQTELITMKTTGDIILDRSLDKVGGKGLFVKELDFALMEGRTDISVHSLKDMPMVTPLELPIVAYSKREDPRDVLILPKGVEEIDFTKPFGCSSQRRMLQLKKLYPDATFQGIRGNVITRLDKLDRGEYSALILAAAGLKRLGLEERISRYFTTEEIIPAAGQAILAVQGKFGADYSYLDHFHDKAAAYEATCERAFVKMLDGGCSSPVAAHAVYKDGTIEVTGLYYDETSGEYITGKLSGHPDQAEQIGELLAQRLKAEWSKV